MIGTAMFHKDRSKAKASLSEIKHKHNAERMSLVLTAAQLLVPEKRQAQISQYKVLSGLSEEQFEDYCQSLLSELCLYIQDLPETRNSYFSGKSGFLNHIFSRCEASLQACRAYFINADGQQAQTLSQEQQLWMYCLFSASLLRGIGKLLVDLIVDIFDSSGKHLGRWDPMMGSMTKQGASFYDYDFDAPNHDTFRRRVTLALATKLMPANGLAWLANQKEVFAIWLALLDEDLRAAGTLGIILDKAEALSINRYFNEKAAEAYNQGVNPSKLINRQFSSVQDNIGHLEIGEIPPVGIEFIKWLSKALGTARLMINQSPLFAVPGGLLMSPDIFKLFIKDHPQFKSWKLVQDAFIQMKLHSLAADGSAVQKFNNTKTNALASGVVLSAVGVVLPEHFKAVNLSNGAVKMVSRNEFGGISQNSTHMVAQNLATNPMQAISQSGQWVAPGSITQATISNSTQK